MPQEVVPVTTDTLSARECIESPLRPVHITMLVCQLELPHPITLLRIDLRKDIRYWFEGIVSHAITTEEKKDVTQTNKNRQWGREGGLPVLYNLSFPYPSNKWSLRHSYRGFMELMGIPKRGQSNMIDISTQDTQCIRTPHQYHNTSLTVG